MSVKSHPQPGAPDLAERRMKCYWRGTSSVHRTAIFVLQNPEIAAILKYDRRRECKGRVRVRVRVRMRMRMEVGETSTGSAAASNAIRSAHAANRRKAGEMFLNFEFCWSMHPPAQAGCPPR